jgi:VIT1/CCC1 family predicted Fe2+/Mn2+ transporter
MSCALPVSVWAVGLALGLLVCVLALLDLRELVRKR